MFGSYRKFGQTEIVFCINHKIRALKRKIIYILIFPTNNFRKSHLKRESLSTLLIRSKTHIQAHPSQAPANSNRATPWSKTHLQAYLQTISRIEKKKKRTEPRKESRASKIAHTTTPDRTTTPNPRLHHSRHTPTRLHPCPISLFLDLPLPFPQLSITLSSSVSSVSPNFWVQWMFCFDFCFF